MPRESQNASGQIILDYTKAIQESVFEQLRVVREGHLRIVFNPDLKVMRFKFPFFPFLHYSLLPFWLKYNPVLSSFLFKIASWEFCARRHEELIPRRSIISQV